MTENGIMVSSPSADDLTSNGDNGHKIITKTAKMPDRLAPPDVCHRHHQHKKRFEFPNTYILDVLCRQQIKLFQVVSTSEFHEY